MELKPIAIGKPRLLDVLERLKGGAEDYLNLYLTPASFLTCAASGMVETVACPAEVVAVLGAAPVAREGERYGTGSVVFWSGTEARLIVFPPFAVAADSSSWGRPNTSPLCQLLSTERAVGVVLVTWGSYAVGVFRGERLVESKTGTGYIHPRHRKGGRSQKRFARRIEEQKKDFIRRVANRIDERFKGHRVEQIFFGGNRLILKPLIDESAVLASQVERISPRSLNIRTAGGDVLARSIQEVYRSAVFDLGGTQ